MKSGIYKITNKENDKIYVGQTKNLNTRYGGHLYRIKRNEHHNEHLQRAFKKYGEDNFEYEILEEVKNVSNLDLREKYWIDHYGGINDDNTYNFKDPLLNEYNDYIKKKMSKNMTGENNPNYGNIWSEEQRKKASKQRKGISFEEKLGKEGAKKAKEKMSKAQKGRKQTEETKEKIRQANIGEKNPAYGKGYRQEGEKNPMWNKPSHQRTSILQFDKEGNLIKEYEYIMQVTDDGFDSSNVSKVLRGKIKTSGGYIWKYKGDK